MERLKKTGKKWEKIKVFTTDNVYDSFELRKGKKRREKVEKEKKNFLVINRKKAAGARKARVARTARAVSARRKAAFGTSKKGKAEMVKTKKRSSIKKSQSLIFSKCF